MVGRVGSDAYGDELLRGLAADGVDVGGIVRDAKLATGTALIMVDERGRNIIAVAPGANALVNKADVDRILRGLRPSDVIVLQLETPIEAVIRAARSAKSVGARVLLNAAPSHPRAPEILPYTDLVIVNEGEARHLIVSSRWRSSAAAARRLYEVVPAVVVTQGDAGAILWDKSGLTRIDALQVTAIDTTAAGDAFVGATARGLVGGLSTIDAVRLGAAAGAAAVTRVGARSSLPTRRRLRRLFGLRVPAARKE
jgi:ribokinase